MKQLVFDVTNADTILDSDSVGAFVRSSDGTLIDHATINSVERLAVDSTTKDGLGNAITSTDAGGGIRALDVNLASPLSIEVDLDHTEDSVRLGDGTDFFTSTTEGLKIGLDVAVINEIEVSDAALADTAVLASATTLAVAGTSQAIVASPLADRKYLYLRNQDNQNIFIGQSGVTAANGFPIPPSGVAELRLGAAATLHFVGSTGKTPEIRALELA